MLKEFKEFMMRGSVIDLAIGMVIGGAFTAIVNSVVTGLITPLVNWLIQLITGAEKIALKVTVGGATFDFGLVITAIITFIITAFVLFLIVKMVNKARARHAKEEEEPAVMATELDVLNEIRDLLAKKD
jgi:large conductance mechanosensitive channel